jgi:thiol-disulfide isomerase/thioredoxin
MLPSFEGATEWLNGTQHEAEEFVKGSPTLVYFWAVSCGICKEKMPELIALKKKYKDRGLKVVAVHMPRYEADTDLEQVKAAIIEHSIDDLVAVDNQHKLKDAFQNEQGWVPIYYLFDAEGKMKTRAAGEYGVSVLTGALEKMFPAQETAAA